MDFQLSVWRHQRQQQRLPIFFAPLFFSILVYSIQVYFIRIVVVAIICSLIAFEEESL